MRGIEGGKRRNRKASLRFYALPSILRKTEWAAKEKKFLSPPCNYTLFPTLAIVIVHITFFFALQPSFFSYLLINFLSLDKRNVYVELNKLNKPNKLNVRPRDEVAHGINLVDHSLETLPG